MPFFVQRKEKLDLVRNGEENSYGNICRSPIAEAVMQHKIHKSGLSDQWMVDSAGLADFHCGECPNSRAISTMKKHGLRYSNRARQITRKDFNDFDYIFGMDEKNVADLKSMAPANCKAKIKLLGDFGLDKSDRLIEDSYYQRGVAGFEKTFQQCNVACDAFLKQVMLNEIK